MKHAEQTRWQETVQHLLAVRRPEQAEQLLRHRLAINPQEAAAHELLGLVLLNQRNRNVEALAAIREAIALDPQQPDAHYFHSVWLLRNEQPFEALRAIEEALRLNARNATYLGYKAVILNARQHPEAALETTAQGLFLDPGHVECLYQRIRALKDLGRYELAVVTLQQLVRWHPNLAVAHAQLGEEALRTHQLKVAEGHFREAIRLNPTNERTQRKLLPLLAQLGQEAQRQRKPDEARRYFLELWQLAPHEPAAHHGLEQLAKESFWLKRQLLRLDAWSEAVQQDLKKGQLRAFLQLYLVMVPLMALFCLPLLLVMLYATLQWRLHPDVQRLRQHSRQATIGRVAVEVGVGLLGLGLIVALRLWLNTVSDEVILVLLGLLAVSVGVNVFRQRRKASSSLPK
ncbi:tetratricopeptide repeat protein [Hymenobacter sp. 5516J-16]|uniref:tetratricopeptide repeat protein n=1 Tax=Hymenobacter sp. 5516J-16 TaxID=2932253 RepID=UPI001FD0BBD5|nr:tetratricopeptide repeat protein [Hymenobacter sp. 5516J-16]UOQ76066.1 tetratricopeptide repeat protein [Hymenobacter sp. 5516J-16]